ncbi:hypothetical protein N2152v2_003957 [Parachlorella kessleri]
MVVIDAFKAFSGARRKSTVFDAHLPSLARADKAFVMGDHLRGLGSCSLNIAELDSLLFGQGSLNLALLGTPSLKDLPFGASLPLDAQLSLPVAGVGSLGLGEGLLTGHPAAVAKVAVQCSARPPLHHHTAIPVLHSGQPALPHSAAASSSPPGLGPQSTTVAALLQRYWQLRQQDEAPGLSAAPMLSHRQSLQPGRLSQPAARPPQPGGARGEVVSSSQQQGPSPRLGPKQYPGDSLPSPFLRPATTPPSLWQAGPPVPLPHQHQPGHQQGGQATQPGRTACERGARHSPEPRPSTSHSAAWSAQTQGPLPNQAAVAALHHGKAPARASSEGPKRSTLAKRRRADGEDRKREVRSSHDKGQVESLEEENATLRRQVHILQETMKHWCSQEVALSG